MSDWNRKLWGVEFSSPGEKPTIIGSLWHREKREAVYPGEPTSALVFCTRRAAREFCKSRMAEYKGRSDFVALWRFRAVRVVEIVRKA